MSAETIKDDPIYNLFFITGVKNKLLEIAQYLGKDVLKGAVKALYTELRCTECSLWSINHNSTHEEKKDNNKELISTSVICRECAIEYTFPNPTDYVHDLSKGLFARVVSAEMKDNPVFFFSKEMALVGGHRSKEFVEKARLTKFFVFPIFDSNAQSVIALLEISYQECDLGEGFWYSLAKVIHPFFSAAFKRDTFVQKQTMMDSLIRNHRKHKNKEVSVLFSNIIHGALLKACPAQGASFFIWDTYQNRYNLVASTGFERDSELVGFSFQKGEGKIGRIGQTRKPLITDEITQGETKNQLLGLFRVQWNKSLKTEMLIPVIDPSDENEVLGVFKLVNKTNECNDKIIDYFNDGDVEMMLYAANYLALIIANYQKEENQYNLIDKLTHEITTPANAILKSANRLYTHLGNTEFLLKYLSPYLKNIIDFAELQRWQASTNLYLSRNRRKMPFNVRYSIRPTYLYEVIKESIDIARPIARKYGVKFDNIRIDPFVDQRLTIKIDKEAFVTVFYNLFTNAIKYHDPKALREQFYIEISYYMEQDYLVIQVSDNGIGIRRDEEKSIFETGYRSSSAIRINASGYGIGLTVIKQIVGDFDGKINITSFKKPTVFKILIPKKRIQ